MSDFSDVKEITKRALQIQKMYYDFLDDPEKRLQLLNYYLPRDAAQANAPAWPLMEWNGHVLATQEQIGAYLSNLPRTMKHQIHCVDAQPLPGNQSGDAFMITISGAALYDGEHKRFFYQRLIVSGIEKKFYIINDYVRWTGEQ